MKWGTNAEKDKLRAEIKDKQNAGIVENGNSPIERKLLNLLIDRQADSESQRSEIEQIWSDEYKMVVGKQWDTTLAPRKAETKKIRPNSQDNFIFPTIYNMHSAITVTEPQSIIEYEEQDIADKLTDVVAAEREKNKFPALWKKGVLRWLEYGSFIWMVTWDQDWIGGKGPDRWVGEVRHSVVKKEEFFPDPAILDLEDRLQECTFINMRLRKKVDYLRDRFKDKAGHIYSDTETQDDEGMDPDQANLYVMWTRGVPEYVPDKWRKAFIEKAKEDEAEGDNYKAQEYKDKAEGILKGVHVAYATRDVILDYTPYIYDDGLYPFVFKTLYEDEESPWGIGEVRNIMMPQIAHNKADEIELEAMGKEGLGGAWYEKGAITSPQMDNIKRNSGKGGEYLEVSSLQGIKERTGPKVPQSITNYKEHKQRMIERITQDTPIQQGMKPGGVTAYSAIAELGSRADTKNKGKIEVLEDALTDITNLEISRISQFYTEPRYFKVKNQVAITAQPMQQQPVDMALPMQGMDMMNPVQAAPPKTPPVKRGEFSRDEIIKTWDRGEGQVEKYIPEFNVKVKVLDEKPTDRNYYINTALNLAQLNLMGPGAIWYTLEEGKFPPKGEVLNELNQLKAQAQQQAMMQQQNAMQGDADKQAQMQQADDEKNMMMQLEAVMDEAKLNDGERKLLISAIMRMSDDRKLAVLSANPNDQLAAIKKLIGEE